MTHWTDGYPILKKLNKVLRRQPYGCSASWSHLEAPQGWTLHWSEGVSWRAVFLVNVETSTRNNSGPWLRRDKKR